MISKSSIVVFSTYFLYQRLYFYIYVEIFDYEQPYQQPHRQQPLDEAIIWIP